MKFTTFIASIILATAVCTANGQSTTGSQQLSQGSAMVLSGSVIGLAGSAKVVIESVSTVGESTVVVLKSLPDLSTATIRVAATGLGASAVAADQGVQLITRSTGTLLVRSGEILAIIPNEIGKALLYQAQR